jgi:hypothetical protein
MLVIEHFYQDKKTFSVKFKIFAFTIDKEFEHQKSQLFYNKEKNLLCDINHKRFHFLLAMLALYRSMR